MRWLLAAVLLSGCGGTYKCSKAEVRLQYHPWKPLPAKLAAVRCDGKELDAFLCDDVTITTSKGKRSLMCNKQERAVFDVND
jgi:hypothetical protein